VRRGYGPSSFFILKFLTFKTIRYIAKLGVLMLKIRTTKNFNLIKRLDAELFDDEEKEEIINLNWTWFIAEYNGKIAGFAGLQVEEEGGRLYGYLARAGVKPDFRGKGIQRELILARDVQAKRQGADTCITYTASWNIPSANNLIACGYRLYSPSKRYGIRNALYFWKKLK